MTWGAGGRQAECEPALCPCSNEGQWYPGLQQEETMHVFCDCITKALLKVFQGKKKITLRLFMRKLVAMHLKSNKVQNK